MQVPLRRMRLFLIVLAAGLLFSIPAMAYNVTIGNFGGISTGGAFVNHVWTPTVDSNLDFADLLAEMAGNDVEVITNGSGTITVNPTLTYTGGTDQQLTLSAQGDVTIQGISASNAELSVVVNTTDGALINNSGVTTNGGSFTSSGTSFTATHSGVETGGGNVALNHTGAVLINNGGLLTGGGTFISYGTDFTTNDTGVDTSSGDAILNHTGTVYIGGSGVQTGGGAFTSWGTDFSAASTGVLTGGGDAEINHTGTVSLNDNCVDTAGGAFTSSGTDFTVTGSGVRTGGGNAVLNHTGDVDVSDGGIVTEGGGCNINSSASASFSLNGIKTSGGNILVQSNGLIYVNVGPTVLSGESQIDGGHISFRSATGITADGIISSESGTGGVLSLEGNTSAIVLNQSPVLGAGNITLYVGALSPPSTPIPTLSEWGMIIFSLLLAGSAIWMIRRRQVA